MSSIKVITFNCQRKNELELVLEEFDFDLFFIQRCPESMPNILRDTNYKTSYVRNYVCPNNSDEDPNGICIVSKDIKLDSQVETGEFKNFISAPDKEQGRCWQKLHLDTPNGTRTIINCLPSFRSEEHDPGEIVPKEIYRSQASELLDMANDTTILVGDFHNKDAKLKDELDLDKRNLHNYIHEGTFTQDDGYLNSIDKIITTKNSNIKISNVTVLKYNRDHLIGHWPVSFNIDWN